MPVQVANPDAQKAVELLFKADAHPLGHGHLKVLTSTMESLLAALAGPLTENDYVECIGRSGNESAWKLTMAGYRKTVATVTLQAPQVALKDSGELPQKASAWELWHRLEAEGWEPSLYSGGRRPLAWKSGQRRLFWIRAKQLPHRLTLP